MIIKELMKNTDAKFLCGDENTEIASVTIDSRKAKAGSLFVCIKGMTVDGHSFISSAYKNGCRAVVIEEETNNIPSDMTVYSVRSSRVALNFISDRLYDHPSKKLRMLGITGTNGKTSSTYFLESILSAYNKKVGVIGTIEIRIGGQKRDIDFATSTTPDTVELQKMLAMMADEGVDDVVMEVSSHSLQLNKVDAIEFEGAVFTNLTQDHLDFHKTMEEYCKAKARLFKMCKKGFINADDPWAEKIMDGAKCDITTFAVENDADVKADNIVYRPDGIDFDVLLNGERYSFSIGIPGRFTLYNALGVIACAHGIGVPMDIIKEGISRVKGVPGRIEAVKNNLGFNVIVDYAHTPDGLENIIKAVREFTKGRVITVFGCGGDRDRTKRPKMGDISGRLSDFTIITSDNPRTEVPEKIIDDIEPAVKAVTSNYEKITDRKEAIVRAINIAKPDDTVIIAGKGHENYEIFKDRTIRFDDREEAAKAIEQREAEK